jgi:transposase
VARYGKRGRPAKGTEPEEVRYRIKAKLKRDEAAIGEELERAGRYILAANILSESEEPTNDELLAEYKGRQSVERGFRSS